MPVPVLVLVLALVLALVLMLVLVLVLVLVLRPVMMHRRRPAKRSLLCRRLLWVS